jgi:hypothetical protein
MLHNKWANVDSFLPAGTPETTRHPPRVDQHSSITPDILGFHHKLDARSISFSSRQRKNSRQTEVKVKTNKKFVSSPVPIGMSISRVRPHYLSFYIPYLSYYI